MVYTESFHSECGYADCQSAKCRSPKCLSAFELVPYIVDVIHFCRCYKTFFLCH
jgi:hypothetical protein